jgi:hypothetical protein
MRIRSLLSFALLFVCAHAFAEVKSITIFQNRRIAVDVPEGWTYSDSKDGDTGVQTVLVEQEDGVKLAASFLPDSENRLAKRDAMEGLMKQAFSDMLAGAVEKEMRITYVNTADGYAGLTVFTDKKLEGVKEVPPDERRYATSAVRRWPGVMMMVTILSNNTNSPAYQQALTLLSKGFQQVSK